jgi:ubiquinone/menaquinone biosynthesis C-methylase UbiE
MAAAEATDDLEARLLALLDHLGIGRAHFATQIPGDIAGLASSHPGRFSGIVLCAPARLDPVPFAGMAERVLAISGEYGPTFDVVVRAAERLPAMRRHVIDSYEAQGWSDIVRDHSGEIVAQLSGFLVQFPADQPRVSTGEGSHAGISYRLEGTGPPLLLLPFFLAPSQWAPAIPALAQRFTVVTLGGRHLGGIAALEDRARAPTYRAMFDALIDQMAPRPGETILDVGCGAGSLDRQLARRCSGRNPITAIDANPFWLKEAEALAVEDGLAQAVRFERGNAEALPFLDAAFDLAFSVTVLEECDADRAIGEMMRVVRPGGRVGVVVRAIDLPQWWNLKLPEALRQKVTPPPQSVAASGVADASLYRRMRQAGLTDVIGYPYLITLDRPGGPIWRYREDHVLSLLSDDERAGWQAAREQAATDGVLMSAHALHCAVGTKPPVS